MELWNNGVTLPPQEKIGFFKEFCIVSESNDVGVEGGSVQAVAYASWRWSLSWAETSTETPVNVV